MPRPDRLIPHPPRPLLAATVGALTAPALIGGGMGGAMPGFWLQGRPAMVLPGSAFARDGGKERGKSAERGNSDAPGRAVAEAVTEVAEDVLSPPDPAPATPSPPPAAPPAEPPQAPPPIDPAPDQQPDPAPDLPPPEVPPVEAPQPPPTPPAPPAPAETPVIDPPTERPPVVDPMPSDPPSEVPQTDLPPLDMPGQPVMLGHDLTRLQPYAEQLLLIRRLTASRDAAVADLARLRALSPAALARRYPPQGPDHDAAALARDLDRLEGAGAEYIRLSRLSPRQRAAEFPSSDGTGHDAAAFAAAQRRALIRARDHDTLSTLSPARRAALYPVARQGHDAKAQAAALAAAESALTRAETNLTAATQAADSLRARLTGGRLTATEAEWLAAYLDG